jgi:hypothetical protein
MWVTGIDGCRGGWVGFKVDLTLRWNPSISPRSWRICLMPMRPSPDPDILSRAQGCLLGQLAGDAFGGMVAGPA